MTPNFEKHTERVALLVTPSQKKFLQDNAGDRGINAFLRWLLDNHIEKMRNQQQQQQGAPLPSWKPCNPGCDPEFNGSRSRLCACDAARTALKTIEHMTYGARQ